jgi:hypothetical protein
MVSGVTPLALQTQTATLNGVAGVAAPRGTVMLVCDAFMAAANVVVLVP